MQLARIKKKRRSKSSSRRHNDDETSDTEESSKALRKHRKHRERRERKESKAKEGDEPNGSNDQPSPPLKPSIQPEIQKHDFIDELFANVLDMQTKSAISSASAPPQSTEHLSESSNVLNGAEQVFIPFPTTNSNELFRTI